MFLRVPSVTQTNISAGIRRLRLLWHEQLLCRSGFLSFFMKAVVSNSSVRKIHKQRSIDYEKYVRGYF